MENDVLFTGGQIQTAEEEISLAQVFQGGDQLVQAPRQKSCPPRGWGAASPNPFHQPWLQKSCQSAKNQTQGEHVPPRGPSLGQTVVTGDLDGASLCAASLCTPTLNPPRMSFSGASLPKRPWKSQS